MKKEKRNFFQLYYLNCCWIDENDRNEMNKGRSFIIFSEETEALKPEIQCWAEEKEKKKKRNGLVTNTVHAASLTLGQR